MISGELSKREINAVKKKYFKEMQVITMMRWMKTRKTKARKMAYSRNFTRGWLELTAAIKMKRLPTNTRVKCKVLSIG